MWWSESFKKGSHKTIVRLTFFASFSLSLAFLKVAMKVLFVEVAICNMKQKAKSLHHYLSWFLCIRKHLPKSSFSELKELFQMFFDAFDLKEAKDMVSWSFWASKLTNFESFHAQLSPLFPSTSPTLLWRHRSESLSIEGDVEFKSIEDLEIYKLFSRTEQYK